MTKELGVWKAEDCALVLVDYQHEMFEVIRSETNADMVELHARLLAKTAKAFDMPIVLSTVGVGFGFNGPTIPSLLDETARRAAAPVIEKYTGVLGAADVFTESVAFQVMQSIRLDLGYGSQIHP